MLRILDAEPRLSWSACAKGDTYEAGELDQPHQPQVGCRLVSLGVKYGVNRGVKVVMQNV